MVGAFSNKPYMASGLFYPDILDESIYHFKGCLISLHFTFSLFSLVYWMSLLIVSRVSCFHLFYYFFFLSNKSGNFYKQCKLCSDAAYCGVGTGSALVCLCPFNGAVAVHRLRIHVHM